LSGVTNDATHRTDAENAAMMESASTPPGTACDLLPDELEQKLDAIGCSRFRATQVLDWLYRRFVSDWHAMTNLPLALREQLAATFAPLPAAPETSLCDATGTTKYLIRLADGATVECVWIRHRNYCTLCVSCQVGCRFSCAFCASGKGGFLRNLSTGEMLAQALLAARLNGAAPGNIVFMGMGEPFDNYDHVLKAARLMNHPLGLGIGARRITISTCGLVPGINRLAGEGVQFELSVSLHAPNDDLRRRLMPVNQLYPLEPLMAACQAYTNTTGRIVTFEYTLVGGVNDNAAAATELIALLRGLRCRVNLIPLSEVAEYAGRAPTAAQATRFAQSLLDARINCTLRFSRGRGVNAACGQLRRNCA
jgi:23S rRNA (adenine2503-C2)-methyltransferase